MKAKCFITFIVLTSMLGWVAVTVSAANGAGDGKSRGSGGVALQTTPKISIHHARQADINTVLQVTNSASKEVDVWIKVQIPDPLKPCVTCVYNVNEMKVTGPDNTTINIIPLLPDNEAGYFVLPSNQTVTIARKDNVPFLNGVLLSFEIVHQCPCGKSAGFPGNCQGRAQYVDGLDQPNGVTGAEVTLNPPDPGAQEAADISCVNGANASILMNYYPIVGSNNWNNGDGGETNVTQIQNSWVDIANQRDNNTTLSGVFPYNCDDCVKIKGPIPCGNYGIFLPPPTERHCQVQRDSNSNGEFGGTVKITYLGPLSPTTPPPPPSTRVVTWTNDFDTDSTDLSLMLLAMSVYPPASETGSEDLNKDGVLDNPDLGLVFLHFGD